MLDPLFYHNKGPILIDTIFLDTKDISMQVDFEKMIQILDLQNRCVAFLGNETLSEESRRYLEIAMENNWEVLGSLLGRLFTKIYNLGYRIHKLIRNKIDDSRTKLYKVTDSWESRIKSNLNEITNEVLSEKELELFPADEWIQASKVVLKLFDFCGKIEEVCNDQNTEMLTNYMKEMKNELSRLGVDVSVSRLSANYDDFLDKRRYQSLDSLGYNKNIYPNIFRYMGQIARFIPKEGEESYLAKRHDAYLKQMTQEASNLRDAFNKGKIKKENGEYQARNDRILNQMIRAGYCYCILGVAFSLSDMLIKDSVKMFSAVEDLISIKK